jgi:integrase/recombinase XerC
MGDHSVTVRQAYPLPSDERKTAMSVLIEAHCTWLRAAGRSEHTIGDRRRLLLAADRQLPYGVDTANAAELAEFLAVPGWGAWTRVTYFRHFAGFYRWAAGGQDPWISFNPCAELASPRNPDSVPHPVTEDQLRIALERSPEPWGTAIRLAAYAGLRAGEVRRIRREHVERDYLTIWQGKGGRTASVPTHAEIWAAVEHRPAGLLVTEDGQEFDIAHKQAAHFRKIGLPGVHLHMFRHRFATMLLRGGADIETVRLLMRHRSLQTTSGYLEISDGQRVIAVAALPTFAAMAGAV